MTEMADPMRNFRKALGIHSVMAEMQSKINPLRDSALGNFLQSHKALAEIDRSLHSHNLLQLHKTSLTGVINMPQSYQFNLIAEAFGRNRIFSDMIGKGFENSMIDKTWNSVIKNLMKGLSANQPLFGNAFQIYSKTLINGGQRLNLFEVVNSKFQMQLGGLTLKNYSGFDEFRSDLYAIPEAGILLDDIFEEVQDIESNRISEYGLAVYRIADSIEELLQLIIDRITLSHDQKKAFITGLLVLKHYLFTYFIPVASIVYSYHLSHQSSKEILDLKKDIKENHQEIIEDNEDIKATNQSILENQEELTNGLEQVDLNDQDLREQLTNEMDEIKEHQNEIDAKIDSMVKALK
ncbi:hypothetical protein C9994_14055 [Marivirga lumbricoides]|nr:hypothetical protein C9994_14055 [Marivirga lumbricoides]